MPLDMRTEIGEKMRENEGDEEGEDEGHGEEVVRFKSPSAYISL